MLDYYYYLNDDKRWVGPFSFPAIILGVLRSKIQLHTPVWSKKTSDGTSEHPSECVRKRTVAHELPFLPLWLFPVNIKPILRNWKERVIKRFNKDDGMAAIMAKPIDSGSLLEGAMMKSTLPSLVAVNDFNALSKFEATLFYFVREREVESGKYPAYVKHTAGRGFSFNIIMDNCPEVGGVMFKESYGLHRKVFLENKSDRIEVAENSVTNFSTRFPYMPQELKGNFTNLKTMTSSDYNGCFQRLMVSVNDTEFIGPAEVLQTFSRLVCDKELFNSHDSLIGPSFRTGLPYVDMQIDGFRYHIYDLKDACLVIDSQQVQDHELFRVHTRAIRKSLAVVSGKYYADEAYYLTAEHHEFKNVEGPWYVFEDETVISSRRVINLHLYDQHKEDIEGGLPVGNTYRDRMKVEVFESLCAKMVKEDKILRTVELVISAMDNADPVQQGAMYAVALETITGLLSKKNEDKLNPIDDKELFNRLSVDLKKVMEDYSAEISADGMRILVIKLGNLNSPTNRDKLVKTFALYGLNLTDDEVKTIAKRDTYLHGNSPLDAKFVFELNEISLKLHSLILKLLLKYAGYSGHFINLPMSALAQDEAKVHEYAKKTHELVLVSTAEIERLIKNGDLKAAKAATAKWQESAQALSLPSIIEII